MRKIVIGMFVVTGFGLILASPAAWAAPANGTAIAQLVQQNDSVVQVLGNCGRGWHRGRWGGCIPGCGAGWYQPYPGAHCRPR
jgi:hypothetical protein